MVWRFLNKRINAADVDISGNSENLIAINPKDIQVRAKVYERA
ncbi:hypothetical protein [Bacillus thuringiensis]